MSKGFKKFYYLHTNKMTTQVYLRGSGAVDAVM